MKHQGPQFYDNAQVFETYRRRRERPDNPNLTLELPMVRQLLGPVRGLDFLDFGCGDAAFGRELLTEGASSYFGVDGSTNMVEAAKRTLVGTGGKVVLGDMQTWTSPAAAFDRATARLALHYVPDLACVFASIHRALRPDGLFVFSVEHPVVTSCDRAWQDSGPRQEWIVDTYFNTGERVTSWMGAHVVKYHRTVEDYFLTLQESGFAVECLRESRPERSNFSDEETFIRRHRIPLFLFFAARKS